MSSTFYATVLGICMLLGRYWVIVPVLAIAGSLARKKSVPVSSGTSCSPRDERQYPMTQHAGARPLFEGTIVRGAMLDAFGKLSPRRLIGAPSPGERGSSRIG